MGIPGLWDILRPAGHSRSLTHLTVVDGFEANESGRRAYRVGIDASIWFFHAELGGQGGENPQLRTLYFRCCRLLSLPILPLFVFDGPKRPSTKRGKRIPKNEHWMVSGMREIIDAFGFEWWTAPGEAEAELAYLNDIGVIDAILSDDVDTFLFGARVVLRNPSDTLSGSKSHAKKTGQNGKSDGNHYVIYHAEELERRDDIALTRGGLILIGLISGGDYNQAGLTNFGVTVSHALARCGYGDELLQIMERLQSRPHLIPPALDEWRASIRNALVTDSDVTSILKKKYKAKASAIPNDFPDVEVLKYYAAPVTSYTESRDVSPIQWRRKLSLAKIAAVCEHYFEWGVKPIIVKRARTTLWHGAVLRVLRQAVLTKDEKEAASDNPTTPKKSRQYTLQDSNLTPTTRLANVFLSLDVRSPTKPSSRSASSREPSVDPARAKATLADISLDDLLVKIHSTRTHASTDQLLEYRVEIDPSSLVHQAESGVLGTRIEKDAIFDGDFSEGEGSESGEVNKTKKAPSDPMSSLRLWMPASMLRMAAPGFVEKYEEAVEAKEAKKAAKGTKKPKAASKTEGVGSIAAWAVPVQKNAASSTTSKGIKTKTKQFSPSPQRLLFSGSADSRSPAKQSSAGSYNLDDENDDDVFGISTRSKFSAHDAAAPLPSQSLDAVDPFAYLLEGTRKKTIPKQTARPIRDGSAAADVFGQKKFKASSDDPFAYLLASTVKDGASKRSAPIATSDSDDSSKIIRSPKKSVKHISPRKIPLPSESSEDELGRPSSPTPRRPMQRRGTETKAGYQPRKPDVIHLSSDDDTPQKAPPSRTIPRRAGACTVSSQSRSKQSKPDTRTGKDFFDYEDEIIDLT